MVGEISRQIVFFCHSCDQHPLVDHLADALVENGNDVRIDPFTPGERTASAVDREIKQATHFLQFYTSECLTSRWVELESRFARLAHEENALVFIPVQIDGGPIWPPTEGIMRISWDSSSGVHTLADEVNRIAHASQPTSRLVTHKQISFEIKEIGRELERHSLLHQAAHAYGLARKLDFANFDAWANKSYTVSKLGDRERAKSLVTTAVLINPSSPRLHDVYRKVTDMSPQTILDKYGITNEVFGA